MLECPWDCPFPRPSKFYKREVSGVISPKGFRLTSVVKSLDLTVQFIVNNDFPGDHNSDSGGMGTATEELNIAGRLLTMH